AAVRDGGDDGEDSVEEGERREEEDQDAESDGRVEERDGAEQDRHRAPEGDQSPFAREGGIHWIVSSENVHIYLGSEPLRVQPDVVDQDLKVDHGLQELVVEGRVAEEPPERP